MSTVVDYFRRMKGLQPGSHLMIGGEVFAITDDIVRVCQRATDTAYWTRMRLRRVRPLMGSKLWMDVPAQLDAAHPAHLWQWLGRYNGPTSTQLGTPMRWHNEYYVVTSARPVTFHGLNTLKARDGNFIKYTPADRSPERLMLEKPADDTVWEVFALWRINPDVVRFER